MFICPKCKGQLLRAKSEHGVFWACTGCNGRAIGLALLRKTIVKDYINRLWQLVVQSKVQVQGCSCPVCDKFMTEVSVSSDIKSPKLEDPKKTGSFSSRWRLHGHDLGRGGCHHLPWSAGFGCCQERIRDLSLAMTSNVWNWKY